MPPVAPTKTLQQLLAATPFNRFYRFHVEAAGRGSCVIRTPYRPEFARPDGIVGGIIFIAAADVAMWLAIATRVGTRERAVTVEMKTNFLRSARKEGFLCRARVMKLGRQLVYGTAECYPLPRSGLSAGAVSLRRSELLSHHTLTYIRLPGDQVR